MYNILFVKGESRYEAMRNYIEEIEKGFRFAGFHTFILDMVDDAYDFQLEELMKSTRLHFVFSCNSVLYSTQFPGAYSITYLCDHPAAHRDRLLRLGERDIVFTCDGIHESYIKRYFPNIRYVKFIPLSGSSTKQLVTYKKRSRDIIFTGTYSNPKTKYNDIFLFNDVLNKFAEHMAQIIVKHPELTLEKCLSNTLQFFGVSASDEEFSELAAQFCNVDWYARSYYRDKMIRILVENGLQIHVYGEGWEEFEGKGKENIIIEKGNFYIARKAAADAKISLNIMPWFKDGFQERIVTGMLSGAVVVTDKSNYIQENFVDGTELVLYSLEDLEELPKKVKWLLNHPEEAEKIANAGQQHAQKSLTWQYRTDEMLNYIQKVLDISFNFNSCGNMYTPKYSTLHHRVIAKDTIRKLNKLLDLMDQLWQYDKLDLYDLEYLIEKFLIIFTNARANYPELRVSEFAYNFLSDLTNGQEAAGADLLARECTNLLSIFLTLENEQIQKEKENLALLNKQIHKETINLTIHSQKVLITKMKRKYQSSEDAEIKEILYNIEKDNYVYAYNQDFAFNFVALSDMERMRIMYDEKADMYFGIWNERKMYYPKGYKKEDVAAAIDFVRLEQDPDSPHRYFDEVFNVKEGDIVIDAGVAEGNFALDIVEKAKKVYLVESDPKWVEALKMTFQPWAEKVVIITKMLGDTDDAKYASIDGFVEEGYVNFIKMDVEGAEIPSLRGATSVLENSRDIKCAICAYHRKNAEQDIRRILEERNFYTTTTKGYMFFKEDLDSWIDGELRRGLVKAVKNIPGL